jgi:hypothetical protein
MATYNGFEVFSENLANGVHNLNTDLCKVYLSNVAPNAATHAVKADVAEFTGGTGYTAGGEDMTNTTSRAGATTTVNVVDVTWTASAGDWAEFRYVVAYNDTPTSPVDPLVSWWDYGAGLTLNNGETFTVDFTGDAWMTIT